LGGLRAVAAHGACLSAREPGRPDMTTKYAILSTYPPTQCGLATFTAALASGLRSPRDLVDVVAVADAPGDTRAGGPVHVWVRGEPRGAAAAAARLNAADVAIIQHEYGIFGGPDGEDVLDLLRRVTVPVIVVLHTVVTDPTLRQRAILDELVLRADAVVTMTHAARDRLVGQYAVPADVHVVPHGAADSRPTAVPRHAEDALALRPPADDRPVILTWGLLGAGKGIEWAIDAMATLRDLRPLPRYVVLGETHPQVRRNEGEAYRRMLEQRVADLAVGDLVEFDARYLTTGELHDAVLQADLVLLPYDSRDQVTSGVLVEAVTARRPVVSTGFPHAQELLATGAGLLVERGEADSIAAAVRRVLTEPGLAAAMSAEATRIAPGLLWSAVAQQYREVAASAMLANQDRMSA
jgi:polysaccharide biosynthesis protein PslF